MRAVLDSNVWVDWLVFDDPGVAPIKSARRDGHLQILIDDACLAELRAVLAYPEFGLDAERQLRLVADVEDITERQRGVSASAVSLPRCSDADDQKFLELAYTASADWLVTRDKALNNLNSRMQRLGVRVGTPAQWAAAVAVTA